MIPALILSTALLGGQSEPLPECLHSGLIPLIEYGVTVNQPLWIGDEVQFSIDVTNQISYMDWFAVEGIFPDGSNDYVLAYNVYENQTIAVASELITVTEDMLDQHDRVQVVGIVEGHTLPFACEKFDDYAAGVAVTSMMNYSVCTNFGPYTVIDLLDLLSDWGDTGCRDLNRDGVVNVADLLILLENWSE